MNRDDTWSRTIKISFSKSLVLGFLISILVSVGYYFFIGWITNNYPVSIEVITLFSGCLIGVSLIFASKAIESSHTINDDRKTFDKDHFSERIAFEKKIFFQKLVSNWYNDLSYHVGRGRNILKIHKGAFATKKGAQELIVYFYEKPEEMESFYAVLNFLEHLALMIESDILNEEDVKKAFNGVVKLYYSTCIHYIDAVREADGDVKKETFCCLERLAKKWI